MKRLFKFLPLLLAGIFATTLWSCSDDDPVNPKELPSVAQTFLDSFYPSAKIVSVTKDKNEYDVVLSNGHSVDFNKNGEWIDVDAPAGQTVPTGFYPADIDTYIATNFANAGINEISVDTRGFEVELVNGVELLFDSTGNFIGLDN